MPNLKTLLAAMVSLAALAGPAQAAPQLYDCDTAPGHLSVLEQVQPGPSYRISGRVSVVELARHERWAPVGNVTIESADKQGAARLQLIAPDRKAPLDVVLLTTNQGKEARQTLGQVRLEQDLIFSMIVGDGHVKVELGTMRGEAAVDVGTGAKLGVSCSTGNFHFEDLRFEQ